MHSSRPKYRTRRMQTESYKEKDLFSFSEAFSLLLSRNETVFILLNSLQGFANSKRKINTYAGWKRGIMVYSRFSLYPVLSIRLLTSDFRLQAHTSLFTTYYSLLTIFYSLFTIHYSLLTPHSSLFTHNHFSILIWSSSRTSYSLEVTASDFWLPLSAEAPAKAEALGFRLPALAFPPHPSRLTHHASLLTPHHIPFFTIFNTDSP